jgi:hypothetical protein
MRLRWLIPATLGVGALLVLAAAVTAWVTDTPVSVITRDVQATADLPYYAGALSTVNVMVWSAAAALSLFVASTKPRTRLPLTAFGLLLALLAADDGLLLHERLGPTLGVPEGVTYGLYGGLGLAFGVWVLRRGGRRLVVLFLLGGALLGTSVLLDVLDSRAFLVEDGAKLLGSLVWLLLPVVAYSSGVGGETRTVPAG